MYVSSRGMPILAHNETNYVFKKQVIMLYGIYSINNYHYSIINTIIILRLKLYTHDRSIQSRRKVRVQQLAGEPVKNVIRNGSLENM